MINPVGSYLFVERLLAAPESNTLILPEADATFDCLCLSVGPGRQQDDGTRQALQAREGDRVICQPKDFWEWQGGECDHKYGNLFRGFIHNRDLVAVIPGPDHTDIYPANDYVLIEPDRLYQEDGGSVVQARESGILVASHTLTGGEDRARQEGWKAYEESRRLWDSPAWQEEPEYYRHRRLHAYLDGLHPDVRRWCRKFAESEEAPAERRGWVQREAPTRGRVAQLGPGTIRIGDETYLGAWYKEDNGFTLGLWPGDTVRWSADHQGVLLQVGERQLLALKVDYLMAVEGE